MRDTALPDTGTLRELRRFLLLLLVTGFTGTGAELLLTEHTEDGWQWAPVVLLAAGVLVGGWLLWRVALHTVRAFQGLMVLFVASAVAGLWLHYQANVEFALELAPDLAGWALFQKAVTGKSPPSLAPGAMALLGLLGLAWSWRHPALDAPSSTFLPRKES